MRSLDAQELLKHTALSANALKQIAECQKGSATKDARFLVQVVDNRKKEGKSNIK